MMDNQEARSIAVIEQSLSGKFNNQQAAQLLERSVRRMMRLKQKANTEIRNPHNALPEAKLAEILRMATATLKECNHLHKQDVLETDMKIAVSTGCLSRLL